MVDPRPSPMPSTTTPAMTSTEDRPPRTPRWVWVFGSVVGLFLLAVGAFFVVSGDHGSGEGSEVHGAGSDPGSVEGASAPNVQAPEAGGETGRLSFSVPGQGGEPLAEFTNTEAQAASTSRLFLDFPGAQVRTADVTLEATVAGPRGPDDPDADREPTSCSG